MIRLTKLAVTVVFALLSFSCAPEATVTEGPRCTAASRATASQEETTVEEPAPVSIPQKPKKGDDNYLRHDEGQ